MIDRNAINHIKEAVRDEVLKIREDHGNEYHSTHEGYAVLLEEFEECKEEAERMGVQLDMLWTMIRFNDNARLWDQLGTIKEFALACAAEAIQVAAVCEKFKDTVTGIEVFGENK